MALVFKQGQSMTQDELFELANKAGIGFVRFSGEKNIEKMEAFAKLVAQHERDKIYAEELELPKPRLTGKFSITAGQFKCTGCTGTWTNREDAQHHSCKDYQ